MKLKLFSPAKVNVFLSVLGPREDGFHELVSVVCPLDFGDDLGLEIPGGQGDDSLSCDKEGVPLDPSNLCLKAVRAYRKEYPLLGRVRVTISKKVPMGGGMGGGSGNGSAVLWGLDQLLGNPLGKCKLMALAAGLGSDCPLFLEGGAVVIRGRGEKVAPLPESACQKLAGREVILLMPGMPVPTVWAYGRFREMGSDAYDQAGAAESRLHGFVQGGAGLEDFTYNNFEPVVFGKYLALEAFKDRLGSLCPGTVLLSGSGSTLFVMSPEGGFPDRLEPVLFDAGKEAFGEDFGLVKARTAPFKAPQPFCPGLGK